MLQTTTHFTHEGVKVGQRVRIVMPDNPRVHNHIGVISQVTDYGAIVATVAAGSGQIRCLDSEMIHVNEEFSTRSCDKCGSDKFIRTGVCLTCANCGESNGGCS